jgi:hypothetical protein
MKTPAKILTVFLAAWPLWGGLWFVLAFSNANRTMIVVIVGAIVLGVLVAGCGAALVVKKGIDPRAILNSGWLRLLCILILITVVLRSCR